MLQVIANIRSRYRLALLAIAILSTATALLLQWLISIQKDDAQVINIAGKQRMLSQKMAWYANTLHQYNSPQHRDSLQQAASDFNAGHYFLTKKNDSGEYEHLNDALMNHYFAAPINLAEQSEQFYAAVSVFLQSGTAHLLPSELHINEVELLLTKLDQAVSLFESQAKEKITLVSYIEIGFWLLTLGLLLLELKFIFRPMEAHIKTTLNKYQQQKQHAELISQNKERFIARASHEFRTPLQGLVNAIDELETSSEQKALQQQAHYCSNRLLNILDELHDAQQLSSGQWQLEPTKDNLLKTIEAVLFSYQFSFKQHNLRLIKNLANELDCEVELDHLRLQQVLSELLTNALKFTQVGQVTVTASMPNKHQLLLSVSDTGTGFASHFPYLSSEHIAQDNHFQGMQMGLARVQHILQAQNASIEFIDQQPSGALVSVVLPIHITEQQKNLLPNQLHCLIVEDNPLNAMILDGILKGINYTTELAENGLIATEKVVHEQYDVIFMDLNMPVMDGFKAIDTMRQELNLTTPIIVVTANTSQSDLERSYQLGSNGHIYKPIKSDTIKKALIEVLAKG
ncbi:response regulator [Pseudoalteromonas shioyasakiensis]|uniref:response regulator n=1 Tax=Pseudoalteromonas shioyasakiensis TaxID=1190813 RepID=UPI002119AA98|nr:response regulator [Pseudoalteromonas shioyasakiensis]MCQ8879247.1 response regulator [Pseudoalteromonas shioyasakiensis]